jgi:hypothetical protein
MDVKDAVNAAKTYFTMLFADEGLSDLGLEEVEFDDSSGAWRGTVGFSRPWDRLEVPAMAALTGSGPRRPRSYKVLRIDDASGRVVSVKARESTS